MDEITQAYVESLLEALARGPIGEEILGVARGERDLVVKENPNGAGWIVRTAPKFVELIETIATNPDGSWVSSYEFPHRPGRNGGDL